jgi:hypothetical protein
MKTRLIVATRASGTLMPRLWTILMLQIHRRPERDGLRRPRGAYDQDDSLDFLKEPLPTMRQPGDREYGSTRDIRKHM